MVVSCFLQVCVLGINCILKSLKFEPDAEVLLTTHTYGAVQNTAKDIENSHGKSLAYTASYLIKNN